jgi:hypothetical protein
MNHPVLAVVMLSLLAVASACHAREVQVLTFRFEIPDSWRSEGGGSDEGKFFATGTKSQKMFAPPNILVEACVPTNSRTCSNTAPPNPPKDFGSQGCVNSVAQVTVLNGGIEETRWICETVETSDGPLTAGISIFRFNGSILYLAHFSELGSGEVSRLIDGVAQSLSVDSHERTRQNEAQPGGRADLREAARVSPSTPR